jgi:hypothetical protein
MRAEVIGFNDAAPMQIHALRAALARADTVLPVIVIGEASAGPAENGRTQRL